MIYDNQCRYIKKDNQRCCCFRVKGDDYCYTHSEKMAGVRKESLKRGGESPKRHYGNPNEVQIYGAGDVLNLLTETINDLRQNRVSTRMANAVGYLAGLALRAVEQNDLAERVEEVEYALKIKNRHR